MSVHVRKNLAGLGFCVAVLISLNIAVWLGARQGALPKIQNAPLWITFVAINVLSLTWATALLGLRPVVVAISYMAGGGIAFYGVQETSAMKLSEVISAGAIYGAFGALFIGNFTAKVRLFFFKKGQIPFVFIVLILLLIDGLLNSQLFKADASVILKALFAPFILAGGIVGVAEVMIRNSIHETGRIHEEMPVLPNLSEKKKNRMLENALGGTVQEFRIGKQKTPAPEAKAAKPKPEPKPEPEPTSSIIRDNSFFTIDETKEEEKEPPKEEKKPKEEEKAADAAAKPKKKGVSPMDILSNNEPVNIPFPRREQRK